VHAAEPVQAARDCSMQMLLLTPCRQWHAASSARLCLLRSSEEAGYSVSSPHTFVSLLLPL
jgi:hypothetical protein